MCELYIKISISFDLQVLIVVWNRSLDMVVMHQDTSEDHEVDGNFWGNV